MRSVGIVVPSFSALQSDAVMVIASPVFDADCGAGV
jgi:hypothetical protein